MRKRPAEQFETRARQIGLDLFDRAHAARPKVWRSAWWQEWAVRLIDRDPALRTRLFQFVDCLPSLRGSETIVRHLREYLDEPDVDLPPAVRRLIGPGVFESTRARALAAATRLGAEQMASHFITGHDTSTTLRTIEKLRRSRMAFTLDVLGESTTSDAQADRYARTYHDLMDGLTPKLRDWTSIPRLDHGGEGPMPRLNLSLKLTGLDPHFDGIDPVRALRTGGERLRSILEHARRVGAFINVDMESTRHRPVTFEMFKTLLLERAFRDWTQVGIAVQTYLVSADEDVNDLLDWGRRRGTPFAIRLVKGAYWDAEVAAAVRNHQPPAVWTNKWESDACYERLTRLLLDNVDLVRPAFASHNVRSLSVALATAEALNVRPEQYEVQMLFGMGDPLKQALVDLDRCVRVYCPYGDLMPGMGYLIRRLLENTSNDSFLKQSFSDRVDPDRLLADPAVVRPPSGPLPKRVVRELSLDDTLGEEPMNHFVNATPTNFSVAENRRRMQAALQLIRGEFGRTYPLIVNGEPVVTEEWTSSINPSRSSEVVGRVALATTGDTERAVASARRAFQGWRRGSVVARSELLRRSADLMEQRRFELAGTIILEVGKPWREADADVTEAIDHCRYYAAQIERMASFPRLRNLPGEDNTLLYAPKGVCAVISPWAFPLAILTGMSTAALAAGNTVVIKPARSASVVAAKFVEILRDVGFPPGTVNFLPGVGATIGRQLVEHADVNVVAFTGSYEVGTTVIRSGAIVRSGQAFIKKLIVEMGGKNAIIVDDDADLDAAVLAVVESAFAFAGQKCSSCSRAVVVEGVYDAFADRLREAVQSLPIGPAEEPSTVVGPVIDAEARERIVQFVETGGREGRHLVRAALPSSCADGYFVAPTVIGDLPVNARLVQDEVFGPVLALQRARDFDHALELANASRYALTGGVFSRSPAHIELARTEFAAGNLYINRRITGSQVDNQPFGGFKLSGTGVKAGSPDYLLHFMDARCVTENTLRSGLVPQEPAVAHR